MKCNNTNRKDLDKSFLRNLAHKHHQYQAGEKLRRRLYPEMKNKNHEMQVLKRDLIKYSKQIGIIECEIPKLVLYGQEFKIHSDEERSGHGIKPSRRGRHTTFYGLCSYYTRIIFVNIRRSCTLRDLRKKLVYELIHYPKKQITVPQLPYI